MKPVYPAARALPTYENLLLEMVEPNILKVTLNRPKSYNALSHGLVSDLTELAKWLVDEYYNIRVVLLYGGDEGKVCRVRALVTERVGRGTTWMPFHFAGWFMNVDQRSKYPQGTDPIVLGESVNTVTGYGYDPVTGMQEPKAMLCQVRAA